MRTGKKQGGSRKNNRYANRCTYNAKSKNRKYADIFNP